MVNLTTGVHKLKVKKKVNYKLVKNYTTVKKNTSHNTDKPLFEIYEFFCKLKLGWKKVLSVQRLQINKYKIHK